MTQTLCTIGDRSTARQAAYIYSQYLARYMESERAWTVVPENIPATWKYLGRGASRLAFLAPDGVVYKVGRGDAAIGEALAYAIKGMIDHYKFGIPIASAFTFRHGPDELVVTAMEYCGDEECDDFEEESCYNCEFDCECGYNAMYVEAVEFFGNEDLHSGNMRHYNGKIYCIDLGYCDFVGRGWSDYGYDTQRGT